MCSGPNASQRPVMLISGFEDQVVAGANTYGHELIDELVIGLSSDPLVAKPDVVDVVKQLLPGKNCFQKQIRSEKTLLKYGAGNTCFCKICVVFCGAKKVDETLKRVEILSAPLRADSALFSCCLCLKLK